MAVVLVRRGDDDGVAEMQLDPNVRNRRKLIKGVDQFHNDVMPNGDDRLGCTD
jgi:hypothetical protein